jgi:hypothetical protein
MSKIPNDKRDLPFGSAFAIRDPAVLEVINTFHPSTVDVFDNDDIIPTYCDAFKNWIYSSTKNTLTNIEQFKHAVYSNGTTQGFDNFYIKNNTKRFRCIKGEYMYHQLAWKRYFPAWKFIEEEELKSGDAVVISVPFANTGNKHPLTDSILEQCDALGIPVLIDCAYFGICSGIELDFSHPCITDVTFSLSKSFSVAYGRIGIRLTREDDDDLMFVYHKINYNNKIGAALGIELLKKFTPDYITDKYNPKQIVFCEELGVTPSQTVLFGIAKEGWDEYRRGGEVSRLSFHKFFHQTESIKNLIEGLK